MNTEYLNLTALVGIFLFLWKLHTEISALRVKDG